MRTILISTQFIPMKNINQKYIILGLALFYSFLLKSQDLFWISFTDKGDDATYLLDQPEKYLSQASLDRRRSQGIHIDMSDVPVHKEYVANLSQHVDSIVAISKWLNAVVVRIDMRQKTRLLSLPYVKQIWPVRRSQGIFTNHTQQKDQVLTMSYPQDTIYGTTSRQISMLALEKLHQVGFTGKGVEIAVLDGGFNHVDQLSAFDSLRLQGRLIATYDFVRNRENIFSSEAISSHGTKVLSTLAGYLPGTYIGAAFDAQYVLAITEEPASESRQEEYNWIEAMEWADSIGVDIIHSSLSYNTFDSPDEDYSWEELDGQHAVTTIAADKAASKGIIVTTGAGNEGNNPWRRITAPCDGDSVLCVGAVDEEGNSAPFSSIGPSADGQVKPDVVAMGQGTIVVGPRNEMIRGNGTSYSSPLIAGLAACLVQGHPGRTSMDVIQAIRLSGHRAYRPDSIHGYGIPEATKADSLLRLVEDLSNVKIPVPQPYAKPKASIPQKTSIDTLDLTDSPQTTFRIIANVLTLKTLDNQIREIKILKGTQQVFFPEEDVQQSPYRAVFNVEHLLSGNYIVYIETEGYVELIRFDR